MTRERTILTSAIFLTSVIAGVIVAFVAFGRGPGLVGTAEAAADTYVLSDFQVIHPYVPTPPGETPNDVSNGDQTRAGVGFTAAWSGSRYPGEVMCNVDLTDGSGAVVGSAQFLGSYDTPMAVAPYLPVPVSGKPVSASGSCESGDYAGGPGYTFDNMNIQLSEEGGTSILSFTAHEVVEDAGVRTCEVRVELLSGDVLTYTLAFEGPDGSDLEQGANATPGQIKDASITCRPIES
jgi:hypothetical protein